MSWWIYLKNKEGKAVEVPHFTEGGTYPMGGTNTAELNVTYNYSKHFDFKELDEKTGEEAMQLLMKAVDTLGSKRDNDYWNPTKGNVGYACRILLGWALKNPEAIFTVN